MKVLLFIAFFFALASFTQADVPCDNPVLRLIKGRDWEFPFLAQAVVQVAESKVCPGFVGRNSCCDASTYDDLASAWIKLYAEVVAVRIRLGVLQLEVDVLLIEIAAVKDAVQKSDKLTAQEKAAINAFLDAIANAAGVLVPDIIANFVTCYSSVLRFYAGLLCRACDAEWNDWVELLNNDTNPLVADFKFKFATSTCNAFQAACSPFFAPFYNFRNAVITALEVLASNIPNNDTRSKVIDNLETFRPPCHNVSECLQFICYRFLQGLDRAEDWSHDSFDNATTTGGGLRRDVDQEEFMTAKVVKALNRVQRAATHTVHSRATGFQGQDYTGTFDPLKQATTLNTNAQTSAAARAAFDSFWTELNLF